MLAEKIVEAAFLYVFRVAFPASLLNENVSKKIANANIYKRKAQNFKQHYFITPFFP